MSMGGAGWGSSMPKPVRSDIRQAPSRRSWRPGDPNSGGTQFLICVVAQPALDGQHTIWGRVAEGLSVVTRISGDPP